MKLWVGLVLAVSCAGPAFAAESLPEMTGGQSPILRVEGGCGPYEHRDERGYCRPNRREERPVCERGWHMGENGRCYPNR